MAIRYTTEAKKYILLKGNIAKRMEAERVSDEQMAAATGMKVRTYKEKKNYPEKFTYPELRKVFIRLKFPEDNLKFVFKLGNIEKTINLDNVEKIVITEDISDRVAIIDGLPTFDTLKPVMIEIGRGYLQGIGMAHL